MGLGVLWSGAWSGLGVLQAGAAELATLKQVHREWGACRASRAVGTLLSSLFAMRRSPSESAMASPGPGSRQVPGRPLRRLHQSSLYFSPSIPSPSYYQMN